jgi:hypothetical protein
MVGLLDYRSDVAPEIAPPYRWALQVLESRSDQATGRRVWRLGEPTEGPIAFACGNCGRLIMPIAAATLAQRLDPPFDARVDGNSGRSISV